MGSKGNMMRQFLTAVLLALAVTGVSASEVRAENALIKSMGGTIYVPAFSSAFVTERDRQPLATTLVVHNIDPQAGISLTSVRYYGSDGALIRTFGDDPIDLATFQSSDFAIGIRDNVGGTGANFIVEWVADGPVVEPVANALMVGGTGTQGLSFRTDGYVIERTQ